MRQSVGYLQDANHERCVLVEQTDRRLAALIGATAQTREPCLDRGERRFCDISESRRQRSSQSLQLDPAGSQGSVGNGSCHVDATAENLNCTLRGGPREPPLDL